jgi:C6 transcription factor Pro1
MDGGEKEKQAAAETRRLIKHAARREPGPISNQQRSTSNSPSLGQSPTQGVNSPGGTDISNTVLHGSPQPDDVTSSLGGTRTDRGLWEPKTGSRSNSATSVATLSRNENFEGTIDSGSPQPVEHSLPQALKGREASLLMYYLDFVFPLQFKMYDPTAAEGGRAWLLSLLLRTPPLYHMTLALSAHVFEIVEMPNGAKERKQASLALLGSALQNLQQYIHIYNQQKNARSLEDSVKVLGCILQMMGFIVRLFCRP